MYADIHSAASATIAHSPASRADRSASGIWPELLSDLCCLGNVWLETESPALTLAHRAELAGLRVKHDVADVHPRRLRDQGSAIGVDPDLVPCALEALADHALPIRILTGNDACVRRVDGAPFAARRGPGWQHLRGDDLTLSLDTTLLDSAWVFQPGDDPAAARELRIYDVDGRAIMVLRTLPTTAVSEHPVWTTLMNALLN
jgi:putative heme degradation protein